MKITIADIMAKSPCDNYPLERVRKIANGRESMELSDAFDLNIPHDDIMWLVTRFLDDRSNRLFAADCAERVVLWYPDSSQCDKLLELVECVRDYAEGRITMDELRRFRCAAAIGSAGYSVTYAAVYADAAADAATDAAVYAAVYADDAAYSAAAYTAACAWQLDRLRFYVDEMEK